LPTVVGVRNAGDGKRLIQVHFVDHWRIEKVRRKVIGDAGLYSGILPLSVGIASEVGKKTGVTKFMNGVRRASKLGLTCRSNMLMF
jgi:hypothetical protein